jgi:5-methylcytosine-specific restriction protein A
VQRNGIRFAYMAGFYSTTEWATLRRRALDRDHWRCVLCGANLHGFGRSRVDHVRPRSEAPELALVLANLRSLCPPCDNARHAEKGGAPGRALVGADASGWPTAIDHPWNRPPRPLLRASSGAPPGGDVPE